MARQLNRLSARAAATATKPGRHADGGGLYLSISTNGGRRWVFLFRWHGKLTEMGLGSAREVSLARARELAAKARQALSDGRSPLEDRKAERRIPTFGELADSLIASMETAWRNEKHRAQWRMTLTEYAAPLRSKPVDEITTADVLGVLQPLWQSRPETASRLRGRIERVLDAARAQGFRAAENPARWRGHLDALLPPRQKLSRGHHAAMPYDDVPAFVAQLRLRKADAARALEFAILTAARSGEVLGAMWQEIDLSAALWTVPAERMKAAREHRVPLSSRAVEILEEMAAARRGSFVFAGQRPERPLSNMALEMVLRRMEMTSITVHGFRSSFRDWASEQTGFAHQVCEAALAHVVRDRVEAAYRRGDLLQKRRELMGAWASFCTTRADNIVSLAARRSEAAEAC